MDRYWGLGYQKKDRKNLTIAVIFLLAAAMFCSYQILVFYSEQEPGPGPAPGPGPGPDGQPVADVGLYIVNVKNTFEGISTELDNIASLI